MSMGTLVYLTHITGAKALLNTLCTKVSENYLRKILKIKYLV